MALLKPILVTLLFFAGLFFGGAMLLPSGWRVEHSLMFSQEPAAIHRFVDDLDAWSTWGAWREVDPTAQMSVGKPSAGVDGKLFVRGDKIGQRRITLTSSDPARGIAYREESEEGTCEGSIRFVSEANGTRVTWSTWGDVGSDALQRYRIFVAASSFAPHIERALQNLRRRVTH